MKKFSVLIIMFILITLSACARETSIGFEYESNSDGTCSIAGLGKCLDTVIIVPKKNGDGEKIISIGEAAFRRATGVTMITLPETVTEIGEYAFSENKALTQINIPSKVKRIGRSAFLNCTGLKIVELKTDFEYAIFYRTPETENIEVALGSELICGTGEEIVDITDENRDEIYKMVFGDAKLLYK